MTFNIHENKLLSLEITVKEILKRKFNKEVKKFSTVLVEMNFVKFIGSFYEPKLSA